MLLINNKFSYPSYIIYSYLTILINIFLGFFLIPIILENDGMEGLGIFGILFALKSIFDILVSGTSSGFVKNLIKYKYLRNTIFTYSIGFHLFYGFVCFLFTCIYGKYFFFDYLIVFIYFGIYILINFLTNSFYEVFLSIKIQHIVSMFRFFSQLFFLLAIFLLYYTKQSLSLENIFFSLFLITLLLFFIVVVYFSRYTFIPLMYRKINFSLLKKITFRDAKKYLIHTLSISFLFHLDVLLIDYFYGEKSAGIYLIIFKIPNTLIVMGFRLSEPFRIIVADKIKKRKSLELKDDFIKLELKILFFSIICSLLYFILGEFVLNLWLNEKNVPEIEYMYLISSIVIILSIMQEFYTSVNFYTKKLEIVIIYNFIQLLFKVCAIFVLFNVFNELSPLTGWAFSLSLLIYFYRKNSLRVIYEN